MWVQDKPSMLEWFSCDPIVEADDAFRPELPLVAPPRPDGFDIPTYQLPDIEIEAVLQKREADVYCLGKVDLVGMDVLSRLFDDHRVRDARAEVVHEKTGKYLLPDGLLLSRVKVCQPDGVFQPPE